MAKSNEYKQGFSDAKVLCVEYMNWILSALRDSTNQEFTLEIIKKARKQPEVKAIIKELNKEENDE